jgi:hypothetical protein
MSDVPSIDDLLRYLRQRHVMRKAIDPSAPDPDTAMARMVDLCTRYPPIQQGDGYDFAPLINGAARETGLDPQELGRLFREAVEATLANRAAAVEAAEDLPRGDG